MPNNLSSQYNRIWKRKVVVDFFFHLSLNYLQQQTSPFSASIVLGSLTSMACVRPQKMRSWNLKDFRNKKTKCGLYFKMEYKENYTSEQKKKILNLHFAYHHKVLAHCTDFVKALRICLSAPSGLIQYLHCFGMYWRCHCVITENL